MSGASSPRRLLATPTTRAAVVAVGVFGLFAAILNLLDPDTGEIVTDITFIALGLVYVPLAVRTARAAQGRVKTAWFAMVIGFTCWLLGEVLFAYYQLVAGEAPSPSWSDAAYLAYYPWVCVALLLFPTARSWRSQAQMILDAVIVTGSFFLISWLTVLRPLWQDRSAGRLEFVVSVAYPVGDVLVMTIGLLVVIRSAPGLRLTLSLLVAGLMVAALADSLWVYDVSTAGYAAGSLVDLLYAANALLIIVALVAGHGARPGDPATASPAGWLSRSLPLVPPAVAAIFAGLAQPGVILQTPVAATGVLLVVSLVLRQILEAAELAKRERQMRAMADRLSGDLNSAAKYVAALLPGDLDGPVRVRSRLLPSREIGGDSYGYLWIDDDHLIFYLIDVSGHGVKSALLSVSVQHLLRARSMPAATLLSPDRVMAELNQLFGMDGHDDHFFTMWYGVYEASTRTLRYASAGHPPALALVDKSGVTRAEVLGGESVPIGMFTETEFVLQEFQLPVGAQVLLCSNGVLGDRLSFDVFRELSEEVAAAPGWTPASLIARLRATADGAFDDDCALVQLSFP